jgi:hypothetical protein
MTAGPQVSWTCATCSAESPLAAAFCGACGAQRRVVTAFCTACGASNEPGAKYCAACGAGTNGVVPESTGRYAEKIALATPVAPVYMQADLLSPPPAPGSAPGKSRSLPLIIAAVAAIVIALAAIGFVILRATGDSSTPATGRPSTVAGGGGKPVSAQLAAALVPVSASQDAVDATLRAVSASNGSLQQLHASALRLSTVVSAARARMLVMTASAGDQAKLVGARKALSLHGSFATALVALPTGLSDLRAGPVVHVAEVAASARVAYQALSSEIPAAAAMNIGPAFEQRLVTLATTQQNARNQIAQLATYLGQMDSTLALSANGRGDVGTIVTSVQNGNTSLLDGSAQMNGPISNRQQVLAAIAGLPVPPQSAASLGSLLTTAIEASLAADQAYQDWMSNLPYDYNFNVYGDPNNADFQRAQGDSGRASSAKAAFVDRYNPLARRIGLRTWSGGQI